MVTKQTAHETMKGNGILWFADDVGNALCGRVTHMYGVKEPPNGIVVHMDHIKTSPGAEKMVAWTAERLLVDLYETKEACIEGYAKLKKAVYAGRIKSVVDLWQFMIDHDCQNDKFARAVAIEKGETLLGTKYKERKS